MWNISMHISFKIHLQKNESGRSRDLGGLKPVEEKNGILFNTKI